MAELFDSYSLRGVVLRNRIAMAPMAQYSAVDGHPSDWHLCHLGSRASGGVALVSTESTAVLPDGRNTLADLGIWSDEHLAGHRRLAAFIRGQGAVPAIQLGHAGRKAAVLPPFESRSSRRPCWSIIGPSPIPFDHDRQIPRAMTPAEIDLTVDSFAAGAARARKAGYEWVQIHAGHGYLLHSFLSPLSNQRSDDYGGSLENRSFFLRRVARACREALGDDRVLAIRMSHTDWEPGGWSTGETVEVAKALKEDGVDMIDVSSGGTTPRPSIPIGPGYQVPGAVAIRKGAAIPVGAVGLITDPAIADTIVRNGEADIISLGRELLRSPYWAYMAAQHLERLQRLEVPAQYSLAHRGQVQPAIRTPSNETPIRSVDPTGYGESSYHKM